MSNYWIATQAETCWPATVFYSALVRYTSDFGLSFLGVSIRPQLQRARGAFEECVSMYRPRELSLSRPLELVSGRVKPASSRQVKTGVLGQRFLRG